ncbi:MULTISPECIES: MobF family relaxase [Streptacidiphilus]|uniref:MobF family relaxase n=1 Tax=Streptacidiphilus cavernicola TaxID=3342716 RepID=A0ABV6UP14_9ACTN|nr:MobF family relaxase [Streptacidiphilus jeojiense]
MAWVTMIGPSDEQVEYRLTGGHGCGTSTTVDAAVLVAAVEAAAAEAGTSIGKLLGDAEAKRIFYKARSALRNGKPLKINSFDAVEVATAAGLNASELYGEDLMPAAADGQLDYHLDAAERPLVWIGEGLHEFGIAPGSTLGPADFPAARRLMRGEDPRTGKTLVEPKLAIAPAAKLPAAPLVRAIRRAAAEQGRKPESLLDSKRKTTMFGTMQRQVNRFGEAHKVPVSHLLKLAAAVGIEPTDLYTAKALEAAITAEAGGRLDARPLLRAVDAKARERGAQAPDLFTAASVRHRYLQIRGEAQKHLRDLPIAVNEAISMAKSAGLDPESVWDTEEIKVARREGRVEVGNRGADMTLDLSKSKSVLLAYADDDVAADVEAIYVAAGREGISALEGWTAYAMRGHHGDGEEAGTVATSGFSGWVMIHRAARPVNDAPYGDPHFHLHVTLANMVRGEDGKWSTVAAGGRDLHRHARATQSLVNARIRRELTDRYGISFRQDERTAAWEIAAIPAATVRLFSKRDSQVRQLLDKLGLTYETATLRERTAASAVSKAPKNGETGVADDVLRAYWQAEGRAAGDDPAAIAAEVLQQADSSANPDLNELCAIVFDPKNGLTSHSKEFTHAAAIAAVLDALPYGIGSADEAEQLTAAVLKHAGHAVKLIPRGAQHFSHPDRYTTADVIAAEAQIITEATGRLNENAAVVRPLTVEMTLSTVEAQHGPGFSFSAQQREVLHRLLTAGHGVDAVVGVAGSGKTTLMDAARQAWEAEGLVVAGTSTAAVAAANLKAEAGITSRTMASWLLGLSTGTVSLAGVDVLVVDEAAMCDDRGVALLLAFAQQTATKVVGIGDPKQLHSPGIGGSFAAVHHVVGGLELDENFRQKDTIERRALELWRDDNRVDALRTFVSTGRVHALTDKDSTLAAMLTLWADKRGTYTDDHTAVQQLLMLAATNETVEELNLGARAIRKEQGHLPGPEHTYALAGGRELAISVGDQVLLRTNDYRSRLTRGEHDDVLNGFRGIIRAVDAERRVLVEWREKTKDGERDVTEWVDADYISGGGLSLGYAITGHKSQGLSVQDTLVYGPGAQANALYTMMSRDKQETHLFLPLAAYETDADRARAGAPASDQERVDRAVAGLIREVETGTEEKMILTELPKKDVPAHLRDIVAALPTPRAPGTGQDEPEDQEPAELNERSPYTSNSGPVYVPAEPFTGPPASPYTRLDADGLRAALRRATAAVQATRVAAQEAELRADQAGQQAAANRGPHVQSLMRRRDDITERAGAIREIQAVTEALIESTAAEQAIRQQIGRLREDLAAVSRFGRPVLRGDQREHAGARQAELLQELGEVVQGVQQLQKRADGLAASAGSAAQYGEVLAEESVLSEGFGPLLHRAQQQDVEAAAALRRGVAAARGTAAGAEHRAVGLRAELARRTTAQGPVQAEQGRAAVNRYAPAHDPSTLGEIELPSGPTM